MEVLIELDDVSISYGTAAILRSINLQIPLGQTTVILGPSGCGKSTLLKVAAGIVPVDSGTVRVHGKNYSAMSDREMHEFRIFASYVFQNAALWANQNILNNITLPLRYHYPRMGPDRVQQIAISNLTRVGYTEDVYLRPSDLSIGEQKLVALARAMAIDPQLYFMDAPLSLLDSASSKRMQNLIIDLKNNRRTLVIVTNQYDFAFRLADWLVLMHDGTVHTKGPLAEVVANWPEFMDSLTDAHRATVEKRLSGAVV